jgi:predicted phosphodiesterase
MRIAIISDIHGNLVALENVLEDLKREKIEPVVCLGDAIFNGPQPLQVCGQMRKLACPIVMGNADEFLLQCETFKASSEKEQMLRDIGIWTLEQLTPDDMNFIRTFQPRAEIPLERSRTLLGYHGSPLSNEDVFYCTTSDEDLAKMHGVYRATVMAGGHTHTQMFRRFENGILINPGSVGVPVERGVKGARDRRPPWSEYAILTSDKDKLGIEFRRLPLDVQAVIAQARKSGMPQVEEWLAPWT